MSEPFIGELRIFPYNFAPQGWAYCDGQLMSIAQNDALFSLLGTTYGGDGRTTFALPDLRGRTPIHPGESISHGQRGGAETHTLTALEMPSHNHGVRAHGGAGDEVSPQNHYWAGSGRDQLYGSGTGATTSMLPSVQNTGGGSAHNNLPPYLAVSVCIALFGVYPSRN